MEGVKSEMLNKALDKIAETKVGEWMTEHPVPWWVAPTCSAISCVISILTILISEGALAR